MYEAMFDAAAYHRDKRANASHRVNPFAAVNNLTRDFNQSLSPFAQKKQNSSKGIKINPTRADYPSYPQKKDTSKTRPKERLKNRVGECPKHWSDGASVDERGLALRGCGALWRGREETSLVDGERGGKRGPSGRHRGSAAHTST